MSNIIWSQENRRINDLFPYTNNPRTITKGALRKLAVNIQENGYTNRIIINVNNKVLAGHQRLEALKMLGYDEINVLIPNRTLTKEEEARINVTDNISSGQWDFEILGNHFDSEQLIDWGMPAEWLLGAEKEEEKSESTKEEPKVKTCPNCGELL